jgi:multicomponent K+:H+ antiporter subunit G
MSTLAALLVLAGAAFVFIGSLGLARLATFFERAHPPTLGRTLGAGLILAGSMLYFGTLHEILIGVLMLVSTPVTYVLLGRAALRRERDD